MLTVEVEFFLGVIKIIAVLGFIIFGIIVDCGGVPGDDRGYIGFRYWDDAAHGNKAFRHGKVFTLPQPQTQHRKTMYTDFATGFKGFCSVFVNAAFAFGKAAVCRDFLQSLTFQF